ncbi:putative quinol monooxygenase [Novosphingobium terrae]|uniref:putative quinol monooxygenase n=1 Tax=Novosphingobium terrae TaxID=2726189 RepID=UPI00198226AF|nr:putative quinol monooxygenase [Novosphingobium terrae]
MSEEIAVVAYLQALEGQGAAVEAVIRPCVEASRQEAGCRYYTAHTDSTRPGLFVFIERWADQAALDAHTRTEHFQALIAGVEGKLAGTPEIQTLKALA